MNKDPRQAQMEEIWRLTTTTDHGQLRLAQSSEPWLIENAETKSGDELRVIFPDGRKKEELPLWERKQRFTQAKRFLYHQALKARAKASSYRGFHVGTALLAFRSGFRHKDSWDVFTGMNVKHAQNMRPTCSEPIAVGATIMGDFDLIIGMVVVGKLREEDVGIIKTLHPCRDCRWHLHGYLHEEKEKLRVVDDDTIIYTAMPPEQGGMAVSEERSLKELLHFHQHLSGDDFG